MFGLFSCANKLRGRLCFYVFHPVCLFICQEDVGKNSLAASLWPKDQ